MMATLGADSTAASMLAPPSARPDEAPISTTAKGKKIQVSPAVLVNG
jgi:hypothetical protein